MTSGTATSPYLGQLQATSNQHLRPTDTAYGSFGSSLTAGVGQERRVGVGLSPMLVEVVLKIDSKLKVDCLLSVNSLPHADCSSHRESSRW